MKNRKSILTGIFVCALLCAGISAVVTGPAAEAVQITATGDDIVYPVSLTTGKDAAGHTVFLDQKFLQYIKQETFSSGQNRGLPFDLDGDGRLSKEECDAVRVLSFNGRSEIRSVEGIEAFPGLQELRCGYTGITQIDVSGNRQLQKLSVYGNGIRELDVSMCPLLQYLNIRSLSLTSLELGSNPALGELHMADQTRTAGEYVEKERYQVNLKDLDTKIDLAKVSDVRIDGAPGDGIHTGYEAESGIVYCSDEIRQVSYTYDAGSVTGERMEVSLDLQTGWREGYDSRGGSPILAQYVPEGETDQEPPVPARAGYLFTGWYQDPACTENSRWSFPQKLTRHITLYAGWTKRRYRVVYDPAGGKMPVLEKSSVDWWTTNLIPSGNHVPVRTGYRLLGWQTERGTVVTAADGAKLSYGQTVRRDGVDRSTLKARWKAKEGYKLRFAIGLSDTKQKPEDMPDNLLEGDLAWDATENVIDEEEDPVLPGYDFCGWYTARSAGKRITEQSPYGEIYAAQFSGDSTAKIPVLYAQFKKKAYTIHYDVRGGKKVRDRQNVSWGVKNLLPARRTKRKNYIFAGWKSAETEKRITKKTRLDTGVSDGTSPVITLKAVWYKKYETKGRTFRRYGVRYQVTKSGKKGNNVRVTGITKKKVRIPKRVFYNGIRFKVTGIKKSVQRKYRRVKKGGRIWKRK